MDYGTGVQRPGGAGTQARGFFGSLFDLSFGSFVTVRIIGILYVISMVVIALYPLFPVISAFAINEIVGVLALLVLGTLVFLLATIYVRVLLKVVMVFLRIAENTSEMVRQGRNYDSPTRPDV